MSDLVRQLARPWAIAFALAGTLQAAGAVADPVDQFLRNRHAAKEDALYRLDIDLDHDGRKDMCLCLESQTNGQIGNMWSIYQRVRSGYEEIGNIDFHPQFFYVGFIKRVRRYGLISYWPASTQEGVFVAYAFRGKKIVGTELGDLGSAAKREAFTKKYFGDGPPFTPPAKVKRVPLSEIAKRYHITLE